MDAPIVFRTNQPAYESPFDLGSGGASITRSTQEGALFANPSLPAFGSGVLRSLFFKSGIDVGAKAVAAARRFSRNKPDFEPIQLSNTLKTPLWLGTGVAVGIMTSKVSLVGVGFGRVGVQFREFGSVGIPDFLMTNQILGSVALGLSGNPTEMFSYGVSPKFYGRIESALAVPLTDLTDQKNVVDKFKTAVKPGIGIGFDGGVLFQKRTSWIDGRLGVVVNDIGNTRFTEKKTTWKQTFNTGVGLTLHSSRKVLHCALDYRDFLNAYKEKWPAKTYTGCKAIYNELIAVGTGFYQGSWTYGLVFSPLFLRLELASNVVHTGKQLSLSGQRFYVLRIGAEF